MSNLSVIINSGMNNPEGSFFVGTFFGQYITFRLILLLILIYFVFKVVDNFAFTPLIDFIKSKFRGKL
jgi:hypothetical protein